MKKKHKIIITFLFTFIVVLITTPTNWDNLNNILQNILVALGIMLVYLIIPFILASITFFNKPRWNNFWNVAMWVSIPLSCFLEFFINTL